MHHPLKRSLLKCLVLLALAWTIPCGQAGAQAPAQNYDQETRAPARAQAAQASVAQAADEATKLEAAQADMDITYEQVLQKPDEIELNYRYARAQIARGELKGAAATLERLLLLNPDLAKVRLLYAVVLYRLDNLIEAERELKTIQGLPMPDALRKEIERYLKLVEKRRKRTHVFGTLGFGFQNDDNRNATPASGRMLFNDVPVSLTGDSGNRHDDTSMIFLGNVGARRDLGFQEGHDAFASYSYYRAEQTSVKSLNLQAHSLQGGGTFKSYWGNATPSFVFSHILLAQTSFLREHGVTLRLDRALNRRLSLFMEFRDVLQLYSRTANVPTAENRNGAQIDLIGGMEYVLNPKMRLGVSVGYTVKNAHADYNAFKRQTLALRHAWLLPRGTFLLSGLSVYHDRYSQPDFAICNKFRQDDWGRFSATYGAPLSLLHAGLKDFVGTITYEYLHTFSSVQNYAYTNNKAVAMLSYKWDVAF